MPNYRRVLLRHAGIYVISNVINAAIPFLLLPILTTYLLPAEYGIVSMFQVLASGILPFMGFNLESAIGRQFYDVKKDEFAAYITNALYLLFGSSVVLAFLLFISDGLIEKYAQFPSKWVWSLIAFSFFQKITDVILTIWRVEKKSVQFGLFRIARTILDMGLTLYLIVVLERSWMGRIEGQVVAAVFFGTLAVYYLYRNRNIKSGLNRAHIKSVMNFGLPLVPHVFGAMIITFSDRLFLTNMISLEVMGIYSVGYQIGMVIGLLQNSFNQAWQPWIYEKMKLDRDEDKRRMVLFTYLYFIGLLLLVGLLTLTAPFILKYFVGEQFKDADQFIFWIALGFAFNGMYKMVVNYLFYQRKTKEIGMTTLATAGLNIVLNYILITNFGAIGAAQATSISFLTQFLFMWYISAKYYSLPWTMKKQEGH